MRKMGKEQSGRIDDLSAKGMTTPPTTTTTTVEHRGHFDIMQFGDAFALVTASAHSWQCGGQGFESP
ncbi:hypothetical protein AWN90_03695 [Nocardia terpenica]|uniref:Uncharacterized protein n=1 Tax=Nocardia terpenica TaxID=455432 RepID=A0A164JH40_9NOCA|nr:hypothetical protein AWN90_03695 [Nocardia terpenica]